MKTIALGMIVPYGFSWLEFKNSRVLCFQARLPFVWKDFSFERREELWGSAVLRISRAGFSYWPLKYVNIAWIPFR